MNARRTLFFTPTSSVANNQVFGRNVAFQKKKTGFFFAKNGIFCCPKIPVFGENRFQKKTGPKIAKTREIPGKTGILVTLHPPLGRSLRTRKIYYFIQFCTQYVTTQTGVLVEKGRGDNMSHRNAVHLVGNVCAINDKLRHLGGTYLIPPPL